MIRRKIKHSLLLLLLWPLAQARQVRAVEGSRDQSSLVLVNACLTTVLHQR